MFTYPREGNTYLVIKFAYIVQNPQKPIFVPLLTGPIFNLRYPTPTHTIVTYTLDIFHTKVKTYLEISHLLY